MKINRSQKLTFRFTLKRSSFKSFHSPSVQVSIITPYQCKSGQEFEICNFNAYGPSTRKCTKCNGTPRPFLYHPQCWHGVESFRAKLYPSVQPLTLESAAFFFWQFRGCWNPLFENPKFNCGRLDLEGLRQFLPAGSDTIPQYFGKLPLELRQSVTESIVWSRVANKSISQSLVEINS